MEGFDWQAQMFELSLFLFLVGLIGAVIFNRIPQMANVFSHGCSVLGGFAAAFTALQVLWEQKTIYITTWEIVPQIVALKFRIDSLSALFLLIISLLTVTVSIYSMGYVQEYIGKKSIGLLGGGFNLFILSMMAVVTVENSFSFLIVWELMSLVSFFLVMVENEKTEVRRAGFVYIVMTHFGTFFIFLSFLTLFIFTGSLDFAVFEKTAALLPNTVKDIIFLAAFIGFGTKAGMIPLHIWLPRAHPAAPSHVSALMSAVMIKTAVYGLLRVSYSFLGGGEVWWGILFLGIGIISALFGILFGLAQNDMKRFLAYSSTENMGIIFMGIGASLIFHFYHHPMYGALALTAALYHVINHSIFKGLLFMGAGSVLFATHTKNVNQLGGLIRRMPWTAALFLIGGIALAGFPPFNGFVSEWATFQSLLHLAFEIDNPWWKIIGGISVAILGLTGAFVAGGMVKHIGAAFLGTPRTSHAEHAWEVPISMRMAMTILAVSAFLLGVLPGFVLQLTSGIVKSYFGESIMGNGLFFIPFNTTSRESLSLGSVLIVFVVLLCLVLVLLRIWAGKSRIQVDETWNCGTPLLPTMEYTGTSFSHPILVIFQWLFRAHRDVGIDADSTYFTKRIRHSLEVKSPLESKLYRPIFGLTVSISQRLRSIQSGNLQSYLAYMILMLIVLLLWVR
ncbi:MAG: hydrogenase 4 subunit B [Bacillota bacterium]|nr:hydrogenase 4 subunit B [Bacillota bacterium]